jgi:hypothetical protein
VCLMGFNEVLVITTEEFVLVENTSVRGVEV